MKLYFIIILSIISIIFASNGDYTKLTQLAYKPLQDSSVINFQVVFYDLNPSFGVQWWASENLQLSGIILPTANNEFSLYNNISIGYYNQNLRWLYSSSNFIEISLHKIKYDNSHSKWINCAYKSRYNYKNFILGYDLNHYFWENIRNNFTSFIIGYNVDKKIIFELKSDIDKNDIFNSFNISISL